MKCVNSSLEPATGVQYSGSQNNELKTEDLNVTSAEPYVDNSELNVIMTSKKEPIGFPVN